MVLTAIAAAIVLSASPAPQSAPTSVTFLCAQMAGAYYGAPTWRIDPDGLTDQSVVLTFNGEGELGKVAWRKGTGAPYYESPAIGSQMKAGFSLTVLADEYVENYVYNAGTTELLYSAIRSGSTLLPNSIKAYKGSCVPAGNLAR
jgi:hypothetical protein